MFIIRPQKCLYHLNHNLILFCRCSSCYLPVCEVCIRIHKNQHIMYKTQPDFQNIDIMIKNAHDQYLNQQKKIAFLQKQILDIPHKLQLDENYFKSHFLQSRQKIISKFQKLLIEIQKSFINQIHQQQLKFLTDLEHLQRQTELMKLQVKQKLQSLEHYKSETRMETIIQFYSIDQKQKFHQHFQRMLNEVQKCKNVQMQLPQLFTLQELESIFESKMKEFSGLPQSRLIIETL